MADSTIIDGEAREITPDAKKIEMKDINLNNLDVSMKNRAIKLGFLWLSLFRFWQRSDIIMHMFKLSPMETMSLLFYDFVALHFIAQLSPGPDILLIAKSSASTTRQIH